MRVMRFRRGGVGASGWSAACEVRGMRNKSAQIIVIGVTVGRTRPTRRETGDGGRERNRFAPAPAEGCVSVSEN